MDWYCERTGPGFWAEPLNAVTNVSFLLAALFAYRTAKRHRTLSRKVQWLIGLAATVGVGSFLFHTYATVWAMYLDVVPILVLELCFFGFYTRDQMGFSRPAAGILLAGLLTVSLAVRGMRDVLNGSLMYLPAWLLLAWFGAYHIRQSKNAPWSVMTATIVLLFALVFRTIDLAVCGTFPYGTHFLWHLLNGIVVYLLIHSIIVNPPSVDAPPAPAN